MSLKCFIGFDPRQPVAFQVCAHSVWEHASRRVEIVRLDLRTLPIKRRGLTEFTYSRFLVPWLSYFDGQSLFLDSDMLVRGDICELDVPPAGAVSIVRSKLKFEWASVMRFDNAKLKHMTPEFIDDPANRLYDWTWADDQMGRLNPEWNHLVGYDDPNPDAKIVHFTKGIPVWPETKDCEFAAEWWACCNRSNSSVSYDALMGPSVHNEKRLVAR